MQDRRTQWRRTGEGRDARLTVRREEAVEPGPSDEDVVAVLDVQRPGGLEVRRPSRVPESCVDGRKGCWDGGGRLVVRLKIFERYAQNQCGSVAARSKGSHGLGLREADEDVRGLVEVVLVVCVMLARRTNEPRWARALDEHASSRVAVDLALCLVVEVMVRCPDPVNVRVSK